MGGDSLSYYRGFTAETRRHGGSAEKGKAEKGKAEKAKKDFLRAFSVSPRLRGERNGSPFT